MSDLWKNRDTAVVDDDEDEDYSNDNDPVPGVEVILSSGNSSEADDDEEDIDDTNVDYGLMSSVASRPLRSTPKWKVNMSPRPVMSNHSWIGLSGASSNSRICLSAKSSCASTTSLVKKVLNSSQDIQINVSEDKLKELYKIIMAAFERKKVD